MVRNLKLLRRFWRSRFSSKYPHWLPTYILFGLLQTILEFSLLLNWRSVPVSTPAYPTLKCRKNDCKCRKKWLKMSKKWLKMSKKDWKCQKRTENVKKDWKCQTKDWICRLHLAPRNNYPHGLEVCVQKQWVLCRATRHDRRHSYVYDSQCTYVHMYIW
jgi:hypothetical protein